VCSSDLDFINYNNLKRNKKLFVLLLHLISIRGNGELLKKEIRNNWN